MIFLTQFCFFNYIKMAKMLMMGCGIIFSLCFFKAIPPLDFFKILPLSLFYGTF